VRPEVGSRVLACAAIFAAGVVVGVIVAQGRREDVRDPTREPAIPASDTTAREAIGPRKSISGQLREGRQRVVERNVERAKLEELDDGKREEFKTIDESISAIVMLQPVHDIRIQEIYDVEHVQLETVAEGVVVADDNFNIGRDKRLFAERKEPTGPDKLTIGVLATIRPRLAGQPVFFRSFDVDDPSTDRSLRVHPDPRNPNAQSIDPNGRSGDDNQGGAGSAGTLSPLQAETNALGRARAELTVATPAHPGDNYRVAAHERAEPLQRFTSDTVTLGMEDARNVSPMLTVWRRLHLEVDSMAAIPMFSAAPGLRRQGNALAGVVVTSVAPGPGGTSIVQTSHRFRTPPPAGYPANDWPEPSNRFEGGFLRQGGVLFPIVSSGLVALQLRLTVDNVAGAAPAAAPVDIFDDDYHVVGGAVADRGLLPIDPVVADYSVLVTALEWGYVLPLLDGGGDDANNKQTAFPEINMQFRPEQIHQVYTMDGVAAPTYNLLSALVNNNFDSRGSAQTSYWIAHGLFAFQQCVEEDYDPDQEPRPPPSTGTAGLTAEVPHPGLPDPPPTPLVQSLAKFSMVFRETLRDGSLGIGMNAGESAIFEARTLAHEIMHQFRLTDGSGGLMSNRQTSGEAKDMTVPFSPLRDAHYAVIRRRVNSPSVFVDP